MEYILSFCSFAHKYSLLISLFIFQYHSVAQIDLVYVFNWFEMWFPKRLYILFGNAN